MVRSLWVPCHFPYTTALSPLQILLSYPYNLLLANIFVTRMTERIKHPEMLQKDNTVVLDVDSGAYLLQIRREQTTI